MEIQEGVKHRLNSVKYPVKRIVLAMASSGAMVTTCSIIAQQRSVRLIESEDGDFLALSLNPLANILSRYII